MALQVFSVYYVKDGMKGVKITRGRQVGRYNKAEEDMR